MNPLISLALSMNILTSTLHSESLLSRHKDLPEQTFTNVAYGPHPQQLMDVYLPAGRSIGTTKSLILVHGGGWTGGDKSEFTGYLQTFKSRLPGWAIFNVNYRLVAGGHLFPAQEQDTKAAVDFIAAHATAYGINTERLAMLGVSAGAHLALLQAYKHPSPKINAVVDWFGPTDLIAMYNQPWNPLVPLALQMVTGTTPKANEELFRSSSPVTYVTANTPPTLLLHGGQDQVVNVSQSTALAATLAAAGVAHELKVYPAERHGRWYGEALTSCVNRIETFLNEHVK